MGRKRLLRDGSVANDAHTAIVLEYIATDTIKTLIPACVALVVDCWSNAGDCSIVSAIDRDGCNLLSDYALGTDGEQIICHAMMHDIDQWIRENKYPDNFRGYYPSEYRLWQWTQAHIKPLGPFHSYQYYEKA